jgi:deoxyadenosine/deoxycytidine kinase
MVIVERSLLEAERVFLQLAIDSGVLAPHSADQYRSYRQDLMNHPGRERVPDPDHIILLKASPETCFGRQRARARPSELGHTDLPGMETVCAYYDDFEASLRKDGRPAHLVDASGTLDDTVNGVMQVLSDLGTLSTGTGRGCDARIASYHAVLNVVN